MKAILGFSLLVLSLTAVLTDSSSVFGGHNEVPLTIQNYSKIETLVKTPWTRHEIYGQKIDIALGFAHESGVFQIRFFTRSEKDYEFHAWGSFLFHNRTTNKPSTNIPWEARFSPVTPNSRFFSLLPKDVIMNQQNGYYNREEDTLQITLINNY